MFPKMQKITKTLIQREKKGILRPKTILLERGLVANMRAENGFSNWNFIRDFNTCSKSYAHFTAYYAKSPQIQLIMSILALCIDLICQDISTPLIYHLTTSTSAMTTASILKQTYGIKLIMWSTSYIYMTKYKQTPHIEKQKIT